MSALIAIRDFVLARLDLDPRIIGAAAIIVATAMIVLGAGGILSSRITKQQRMRSLERRRHAMKRARTTGNQSLRANRAAATEGRYTLMNRFAEVLRLRRLVNVQSLRTYLSRAGWYDPSSVSLFLSCHVILPLICAALMALLTENGPLATEGTNRYLLIAAGGLAGFAMPSLALKNAIQKRQEKLEEQYPEALDLMLVCIEAGLSVEAAFQRVTDELMDTYPEISEEFRFTSAELAFKTDRQQVFANIADRIPTPSFRSLSSTLNQTESWGTSVTDSLRTLAEENRKHRWHQVRQKGEKLDAKLSVPLILFIFPLMLIVMLGPSAIKLMG